MTMPRRLALLDWAARHDALIVEDAANLSRHAATRDYFLGSRNIPWWAAGVSLYALIATMIHEKHSYALPDDELPKIK